MADRYAVLCEPADILFGQIDAVHRKHFIRKKADLSDEQKIYDVKDIYIENISDIKNNSTTKLKAQYYLGPRITESEVVDKIKGRGLGDASREIRDIYGVSDVTINPSYPWVMTVPTNSNKVTMHFEVKDEEGNEIKEQDGDSEENSSDQEDSDSEDKETEE